MMIYPSIDKLLNLVGSKYELVHIAARRSKQIAKDEFLQMIIDIIQKDVDKINLVKMESEEAKILGKRTFLMEWITQKCNHFIESIVEFWNIAT